MNLKRWKWFRGGMKKVRRGIPGRRICISKDLDARNSMICGNDKQVSVADWLQFKDYKFKYQVKFNHSTKTYVYFFASDSVLKLGIKEQNR